MPFWKCFLSIIAISVLAQVSVHCKPADEEHSPNDKSFGSWSGLSDILEINNFDPGWQEETQSGYREDENNQVGRSSPRIAKTGRKIRRKRRDRNTPENRERQRIYRQNFRNRLKSNPEAQQRYREKKKKYNRKWEANRILKLTESEKEALKVRNKQAKLQSNLAYRSRCGGYSSPKQQHLVMIRGMKAAGIANEDDLKILHEYQEEQKLKARKRRAAKKRTN